MKIKKKLFKSFKNKYKNYLEEAKTCLEYTGEKLLNYSQQYGPKEELQRDMFRFNYKLNVLYEIMADIEMLEGKR